MARRYGRYRRKTKPLSTRSILILLIGVVGTLAILSLDQISLQLTEIEMILLIAVLVIFSVCFLVGIRYLVKRARENKFINVTLGEVDAMTGVEFEDYIGFLFEKQGYSIEKTPTSGDLGVDLILTRNGERVAVQAKRYKDKVGRSAISDAVAGMAHYRCGSCMVVTCSTFTPLAQKLAYTNRCKLIDREGLRTIISFAKK